MKTLTCCILALLSSFLLHAQDCACPTGAPEGGTVMKTWQFANGNALGICGYSTVELADTTFTKFVLFRCGEDKVIENWTVNISCKAERTKDALLIKEMYNLPVGGNFSTLWRPFYVHQFTFQGGKVVESEYFDKKLPKYSKAQIASVINQYKELPQGGTQQTIKVANMLFWAAVSGSSEAEGYFKTILEKFGPFSEVLTQEWNDINARYEQWKSRK